MFQADFASRSSSPSISTTSMPCAESLAFISSTLAVPSPTIRDFATATFLISFTSAITHFSSGRDVPSLSLWPLIVHSTSLAVPASVAVTHTVSPEQTAGIVPKRDTVPYVGFTNVRPASAAPRADAPFTSRVTAAIASPALTACALAVVSLPSASTAP